MSSKSISKLSEMPYVP